mmetsp:Transcript_53187/g.154843  ORF Transcript_53187/g.154843 Transcript_53187/m.154843 type:complete len:281 (-) Transcript_53187:616-1458(-)
MSIFSLDNLDRPIVHSDLVCAIQPIGQENLCHLCPRPEDLDGGAVLHGGGAGRGLGGREGVQGGPRPEAGAARGLRGGLRQRRRELLELGGGGDEPPLVPRAPRPGRAGPRGPGPARRLEAREQQAPPQRRGGLLRGLGGLAARFRARAAPDPLPGEELLGGGPLVLVHREAVPQGRLAGLREVPEPGLADGDVAPEHGLRGLGGLLAVALLRQLAREHEEEAEAHLPHVAALRRRLSQQHLGRHGHLQRGRHLGGAVVEGAGRLEGRPQVHELQLAEVL